LLSIGIYYKLLVSSKEVNRVLSTNNNDDGVGKVFHKELRWRIPFTTLKHLDLIEHDWSSKSLLLTHAKRTLHHLPNILLEKPICLFLKDSNEIVKKWVWKEKSKCFPIINNNAYSIKHGTKRRIENKKKIQFNAAIINNLALLDQAIHNKTTNSSKDMMKVLNSSKKKHCQYITKELPKNKNRSAMGTFLPYRRIDDFRIIQSGLKQQRGNNSSKSSSTLCELDNIRFKFD
jgi:hypothetical protein